MASGERVKLATIGRINTQHIADKTGRGKPAFLAVTSLRVLAILPRSKGLFGKKDPEPLSMPFAPSEHGNVFEGRVLTANTSNVLVGITGPSPRSIKGAYIIWKLATGDPDDGNFWAVNIEGNALAGSRGWVLVGDGCGDVFLEVAGSTVSEVDFHGVAVEGRDGGDERAAVGVDDLGGLAVA